MHWRLMKLHSPVCSTSATWINVLVEADKSRGLSYKPSGPISVGMPLSRLQAIWQARHPVHMVAS
jgi:hypothetical protein